QACRGSGAGTEPGPPDTVGAEIRSAHGSHVSAWWSCDWHTSLVEGRRSRRCGGIGRYLSGFLGDGDGASAGATQDRRGRNPTEQQPPGTETHVRYSFRLPSFYPGGTALQARRAIFDPAFVRVSVPCSWRAPSGPFRNGICPPQI